MQDLRDLSIGLVMDMFVEKGNDDYEYATEATQEDIDRL